MEYQYLVDSISSIKLLQQLHQVFLLMKGLLRAVSRILVKDWRTNRHVLFALLLIILTTTLIATYYINHPKPDLTGDTDGYLTVVQSIQARGQLVSPWRLPGYPLLIALVFALTGQNNLLAVSIVQAVLFVITTLELYVLAVLVFRRSWVAFLIGLLVGCNLTLFSFVKPIMSEALTLWLVVSLALATVLFVQTLRLTTLWIAISIVVLLIPILYSTMNQPLLRTMMLLQKLMLSRSSNTIRWSSYSNLSRLLRNRSRVFIISLRLILMGHLVFRLLSCSPFSTDSTDGTHSFPSVLQFG